MDKTLENLFIQNPYLSLDFHGLSLAICGLRCPLHCRLLAFRLSNHCGLSYRLEMDKQLAERLEKIESHLAHLEHLYDQLNQVVLEQGRALGRMQIQQQRISRTIETMELDRIKSTHPRPPHYQ